MSESEVRHQAWIKPGALAQLVPCDSPQKRVREIALRPTSIIFSFIPLILITRTNGYNAIA